jgi:DNA (cytosine-5)-methyltransferase 1
VEDIAALTAADLPGQAELAWASFPCQDLSLAGAGAGLAGERSGTFHAFLRLMGALAREDGRRNRRSRERPGALTSHGGQDFACIAGEVAAAGIPPGASSWTQPVLPQSRPRSVVVAVRQDSVPAALARGSPAPEWHTASVRNAFPRAAGGLAGVALVGSARSASPLPHPERPPRREPCRRGWHSPEYTRA